MLFTVKHPGLLCQSDSEDEKKVYGFAWYYCHRWGNNAIFFLFSDP
jgi:hypothetical protein